MDKEKRAILGILLSSYLEQSSKYKELEREESEDESDNKEGFDES